MKKRSKKYKNLLKSVVKKKKLTVKEILYLVKKNSTSKFDESIDVSLRINLKQSKGGDFNLSLITLDEGPRMMARVEGINPDEVEIGQKVKARISDLNGEPAIIFDVIKG